MRPLLLSSPASLAGAALIQVAMRSTGIPRLALDLRSAANSPGGDGNWLAQPHDFRSIGSTASDWGFFPTPVAKRFDVLVYLDQTTPTRLMRKVSVDSTQH